MDRNYPVGRDYYTGRDFDRGDPRMNGTDPNMNSNPLPADRSVAVMNNSDPVLADILITANPVIENKNAIGAEGIVQDRVEVTQNKYN